MVYFADGTWSHRALERISEKNRIRLAAIVARWPNADPVLQQHASQLGIPFLVPQKVNSADFISRLAGLGADILVSMSYDQIFKDEIRSIAPMGLINCHAGALPFYRGRNVLNWAIINGERRFGVTVHHVDSGIDTGDIILQKFAAIDPEDDYGDVLAKAVELCAMTLDEALDLIATGLAERTLQSSIHPVGFYCGKRLPGDEWIDWNWTTERVHNFVRALALPGPAARSRSGGVNFAILSSTRNPDAPSYIGHPGEVIGRTASGSVVKTGDATIVIKTVASLAADGTLTDRRTAAFPIGTRFLPNFRSGY